MQHDFICVMGEIEMIFNDLALVIYFVITDTIAYCVRATQSRIMKSCATWQPECFLTSVCYWIFCWFLDGPAEINFLLELWFVERYEREVPLTWSLIFRTERIDQTFWFDFKIFWLRDEVASKMKKKKSVPYRQHSIQQRYI